MISLIRIDDRLIHGQVMAVWARVLGTTHILVIDDETAADAFSQQIMQLAMPPSIKLNIASTDAATDKLRIAEIDHTRTLVLLRNVDAALRLHATYPFRELNVGGIGMAPGRNPLWRSIAASPEEIDHLSALRDRGVDVYLQMIPSDEKRRMVNDQS
jgi:mannose/fructose/N-acetylgalactosamine-specific phosphotransferase system component IIB